MRCNDCKQEKEDVKARKDPADWWSPSDQVKWIVICNDCAGDRALST